MMFACMWALLFVFTIGKDGATLLRAAASNKLNCCGREEQQTELLLACGNKLNCCRNDLRREKAGGVRALAAHPLPEPHQNRTPAT